MSTRAVEQVDDWETRPFSGGYRGLHDLADEGFSGIVTAGPTRLCMTKGTVVGVLDGSIEAFEDASGTAHEAPSPALPLLAVMQEGESEVRAQYYTEETPIREVDGTLSDGNFTGFIELSENVLSGDYYVVYHQGRSMSVAYVGNAKQLLTEDEAFERANGEVGIYEVIDAEIDVVEIPDAGDAAGAGTGGAVGAATATEPADTDATDPAAAEPEAEAEPAPDGDSGGAQSMDAGGSESTDATGPAADAGSAGPDSSPGSEATTGAEAERADGAAASPESEPRREDAGRSDSRADSREEGGRTDTRPAEGSRSDTGGRDEDRRREDPGRGDARQTGGRADERERRGETGTRSRAGEGTAGRDTTSRDQSTGGRSASGADAAPAGGTRRQDPEPSNSAVGSGTVGDLETRTIPSLDPARTSEPEQETSGGAGGVGVNPQPEPEPEPHGGPAERGQPREPRQGGTADHGGERGAGEQPPREPAEREPRGDAAPDPGEIERLEAELDDREAEIRRLEDDLEARDERIEELEAELEEVRAERADLQTRIERMEDRIDDLRTGEGGASIADRQRMSPGEAIDGTNLFIRYGSKGEATLENAHAGSATRDDVNDNLQIQYHTQFDHDTVAVDGDPFSDYLESTIQYRFVEWVVRVLPYEIRDTGHEGALKDLYDAMPRIDRAELNGVVSVVYEEDGEEHRSQESFDVVLRDRMGNPLAVANMNESRDPASQGMMEGLITAAQRVSESKESLAGAFLVTSSFFEPEAMEAASKATGGGLLSRDKRESFVKLSRKEGFHLCLVEAREAQFNLSVPEI